MQWWEDDEEEEAVAGKAATFPCPYCWEEVEPPLDDDLEGELVWDCEVCCRPWLIKIAVNLEEERVVTVNRAQNG